MTETNKGTAAETATETAEAAEAATAWMIGINLVGCLPEDDEPATYVDWAEASFAYETFCRDWADQSDEGAEGEGSDVAFIESVLSDPSFPREHGKGYVITVRANDGNAYALWLTPYTPEPVVFTTFALGQELRFELSSAQVVDWAREWDVAPSDVYGDFHSYLRADLATLFTDQHFPDRWSVKTIGA